MKSMDSQLESLPHTRPQTAKTSTCNFELAPCSLDPIATWVFKGFCFLCQFLGQLLLTQSPAHWGVHLLPSLVQQLHLGGWPLSWPKFTLRTRKSPSSKPKDAPARVPVTASLPSILIYVYSQLDWIAPSSTLVTRPHPIGYLTLRCPLNLKQPPQQNSLPPSLPPGNPVFLLPSLLENDTSSIQLIVPNQNAESYLSFSLIFSKAFKTPPIAIISPCKYLSAQSLVYKLTSSCFAFFIPGPVCSEVCVQDLLRQSPLSSITKIFFFQWDSTAVCLA